MIGGLWGGSPRGDRVPASMEHEHECGLSALGHMGWGAWDGGVVCVSGDGTLLLALTISLVLGPGPRAWGARVRGVSSRALFRARHQRYRTEHRHRNALCIPSWSCDRRLHWALLV